MFDVAEVFPNHERTGTMCLYTHDREQLVGGQLHVCSLCGLGAGGNPELSKQAHHVIDAQAAHALKRPAQHRDQRLIVRGP
jgi:hypothetical protein